MWKPETLEEKKQSLINLIEWYRDKYHSLFNYNYHNDITEKVKSIKNEEDLEIWQQVVDSWLD